MKPRLGSKPWALWSILAAVVLASFFLISVLGPLPAEAGWLPNSPAAITNQQKAAILGAQNLLVLNQASHLIYLPALQGQ
jgi:hypothetical protein